MTTLLRREFLWQALTACGAATYAPALGAQSDRSDRAAATGAGYFGDRADAARAIGDAYLRRLGRSPARESVLASARGTIDVIGRSRDEPGAIRALVRAVRQDFERGRTVQLEGWIVSTTEAELCALMLLA